MGQPGTRSRIVLATLWLVVGAGMIAVPGWLGATRWAVILSGHPISLALTALCALGGVVAVVWAIASLFLGARYDREVGPGDLGHRTNRQLIRRAKWRIGLAVPALMVCVLTASVLAWARPFPASQVALDAMRSTDQVRVSDRFTWYEMQSVRKDSVGREIRPTTGLVFYPGARVDPRAYAEVLGPLASAGFLVIVLKEPLGIALTDVNHAERVLEFHPEITSWAVGGHSLGGVAASSFADAHQAQIQGLVLWASYPATKMARSDLKVMSISGSADGLAKPTDIADSKANLPPTTQFVVIRGGIHGFFGDYGNQPGDGVSTVTRQAAQAQIVRSTQNLLTSLAPPPKKK